jgi:two-component system sensor histidine kinase YesM
MKRLAKFWYKLSIKNKQLVFYCFLILFIFILSFYSVYNTYNIVDDFNKDISSYYTVNQFYENFSENKNLLHRYLKTLGEQENKDYKKNVLFIGNIVEKVDEESNSSLETYFLINAIRNAKVAYDEKCTLAINERLAGNDEYFKYLYEAEHIGEYIEGYTQQLLSERIREGNSYYRSLITKTKFMKNITFLGIAVMFFLCINFINLFSSYITNPIRKLASASAQMATGNLDVNEVEVRYMDEVGSLAKSFNEMSNSIKKLVEDLRLKSNLEKKLHDEEMQLMKMQQLLKESEFLALQSQINPHFLFNTLNSIARTSMLGQTELTTKLIRSLSNIFRYNLRQHNSAVTLDKELDTIKEYVFIQQHRFGHRLNFDFVCEVETKKILVPCFSLQPLVENSIIHGIEPLEKGGRIRIKIEEKNDYIFIKVIDNGTGIKKEMLKEINKCNYSGKGGHTTGIGLSNVISRLRLYFNEECIKVRSKVGIGTLVEISFPINEEGEMNV